MHIDQDKLIVLISDASGISGENVEKQLTELVEEISQALEDGEAYEIDDFGVFSAMGNNVIFIPADNLETEINYKYVGMEAIEVEDTAVKEEEEIPDEDDSDPFAGLLGDNPDEEVEESFEEFISEEEEVIEETAEEEPAAEEAIADEDDIFNIGNDTDELIPEDAPGPEKWGIDTYKDDSAEGVFSGMMRDSDQEDEEDEVSEAEVISSGSASDDIYAEESLLGGEEDFDEDFEDPFAELAKNARSKLEEESPETTAVSPEAEEEDDDEADVFAGLADLENLNDDEEEDETESEEPAATAPDESADYVPVVANIGSDKKPEKEQKKEEPEKKTESKEYKPRSRTKKSTKQGSPSLLLVVIVILIGAGLTYGLAYFGIVNIEGITPQNRQVQLAQQNNVTPPPPVANEQQSEEAAQAESEMNGETDNAVTQGEQPSAPEAEANLTTGETNEPETTSNQNEEPDTETELPSVAEVDQDRFGLMGQAVAEANSGYTIVLYTLTNQDNAEREYERLSSIGFRTLMQQRQNSSYGTVYRLSIGQFSTLTDAAIAAEDLGDGIPENYIISRIN